MFVAMSFYVLFLLLILRIMYIFNFYAYNLSHYLLTLNHLHFSAPKSQPQDPNQCFSYVKIEIKL